MEITNKILFFLFFLSSLNVLRHIYFIAHAWASGKRYVLGKLPLSLLGIAVAYILTTIATGIV